MPPPRACHRGQSEAIRGDRGRSKAISGNRGRSEAISGNRWQINGRRLLMQSVAISGNCNQWQSTGGAYSCSV